MQCRPIFYDTETTGVRFETDAIIELAAYDPIRKQTFSQLINPGKPIPPEATAIHQITDSMVALSPPFQTVFGEFIHFCEGQVILIAHNNDAFDRPFLEAECAKHQLQLPSWLFLDSLKWARRYRCDLPRHSLQFLREVYGVAANQAHRALDDVYVLAEVFQRMVDDLSIEQICRLIDKPREIKVMPFGKHQGELLEKVPKTYLNWLSSSGALDKAENQTLKAVLLQKNLI